jgi:FixJ family two-component response regulator
MKTATTVFVVDDDPDVRESLRWLFDSVGLAVEDFASSEAFLESYRSSRPGCLLLDVRMPGMDGLGLLERLNRHHVWLPTIIVTGHGDIPMAVRAMKLGAVDFVQKPANHQRLLELVRNALRRDREFREQIGDPATVAERLASLTPREREVLDGLVKGESNKVIAFNLAVGIRTVETHRARIMEKMQASSIADLVRMTLFVRWGP